MKSPWQIGFLGLALTGVTAYDLLYFQNRAKTQVAQRSQTQVAMELPAAASSSINEPAAPIGTSSLPQISREDLNRLAQQVFMPKADSEPLDEDQWPRRDPFSIQKEIEPPPPTVAEVPVKKESAPAPALTEPQCVFSGALIQADKRLALVDGMPLAIGARIGMWQLARIEADHIVLESGKEMRRIEMRGVEPHNTQRKDPL
jgi:hypothetical protein